MDNQTALQVARREKRLRYWQEHLQAEDLSGEQQSKFSEALDTYRLLIAKLVRVGPGDELSEVEQRLSALERELTTVFENRRLATTTIGSHNRSFEPS